MSTGETDPMIPPAKPPESLPCPWCGGTHLNVRERFGNWWVECNVCLARCGVKLAEADAVQGWNRVAAARAEAESLRRERDEAFTVLVACGAPQDGGGLGGAVRWALRRAEAAESARDGLREALATCERAAAKWQEDSDAAVTNHVSEVEGLDAALDLAEEMSREVCRTASAALALDAPAALEAHGAKVRAEAWREGMLEAADLASALPVSDTTGPHGARAKIDSAIRAAVDAAALRDVGAKK